MNSTCYRILTLDTLTLYSYFVFLLALTLKVSNPESKRFLNCDIEEAQVCWSSIKSP